MQNPGVSSSSSSSLFGFFLSCCSVLLVLLVYHPPPQQYNRFQSICTVNATRKTTNGTWHTAHSDPVAAVLVPVALVVSSSSPCNPIRVHHNCIILYYMAYIRCSFCFCVHNSAVYVVGVHVLVFFLLLLKHSYQSNPIQLYPD